MLLGLNIQWAYTKLIMKFLSLILIATVPPTTVNQATWPVNQISHQVEFTSALEWPTRIKSNEQRQAVVKNWYLSKLTDIKNSELRTWANEVNATSTAYSLPAKAYHQYSTGTKSFIISYKLKLIPNIRNLKVNLYDFKVVCISEDSSGIIYLESLENVPAEVIKVLDIFRKKIDTSLKNDALFK
jgi:hypothetical protein